jgi:hypothetical protein
MPPSRTVLKIFLYLAVWEAVLLGPWPGLEPGYAWGFRKFGNAVFYRFWVWSDGKVRFLDAANIRPQDLPPGVTPPKAEGERDTLMVLENRRVPIEIYSAGFLRTSSRLVGYWPTAVFLGWVLATPTSWRRRLWALFWGMLLVHAFIAFRLSLTLALGFSGDKPHALFHPGPQALELLGKLVSITLDDPPVSFVVPTFIWFVLLFRPSQWPALGPPENRAERRP